MDETALSDSTSVSPEAAFHQQGGTVPDRPCDVCRKRKSRCVKEAGQLKCVLCSFHGRDCTYLDAPTRRKRKRADESNSDVRLQSSHQSGSPEQRRSLLDSTLGLRQGSHSRYIGSSSYHEPTLWKNQNSGSASHGAEGVRCLAEDAFFFTEHDSRTAFHAEETTDIDRIESIVRPHGSKLVHVYFRIVHPSFPILHKGVFLEKYARSYSEFSPPLLAAVYLLAMDWWEYDMSLSQSQKPDSEQLLQLALKTFTSVVTRPKLSTVQAGLLLLQRSRGSSWIMTSQVVAVAEELGLHRDCSAWSIPEWERGLRTRLAWAVMMQDIWTAALYGRPSHVNGRAWSVRPVVLSDFPETAADQDDQDGSTEVEKGRRLFVHLTALTDILVDIVDLCYSRAPKSMADLEAVLQQAKPIAMRLRKWKSTVPAGLSMEDVTARKLCSNGYMHLAYYTTELLLHRYIIRCLTQTTDPQLVSLCREAAKSRVDAAVSFVDALRPEHLHSFWWFASVPSLVLVGLTDALLWLTSPADGEATAYKAKLEEYRWSLKLRSKGVNFMTVAIEELDRSMPSLEHQNRRVNQSTSGGQYGSGNAIGTNTDVADSVQQTTGQQHFDWTAFDEAFSPFPLASLLPQNYMGDFG